MRAIEAQHSYQGAYRAAREVLQEALDAKFSFMTLTLSESFQPAAVLGTDLFNADARNSNDV